MKIKEAKWGKQKTKTNKPRRLQDDIAYISDDFFYILCTECL